MPRDIGAEDPQRIGVISSASLAGEGPGCGEPAQAGYDCSVQCQQSAACDPIQQAARHQEQAASLPLPFETGDAEQPGHGLVRVPTVERMARHREALADLPDLTDLINSMGLYEEYTAFRDRFLAWRRGPGRPGSAQGARGECNHTDLRAGVNATGFGYWYPTKEVWNFRRTLSFWIAVTFFEGSVFFTVSSFALCYEEALGDYKRTMTIGGYVAGKVNFLICTYFMCLEAINLDPAGRHSSPCDSPCEARMDCHNRVPLAGEEDKYRYNPFRARAILGRLDRSGAGPWPYLISLIYFVGVLLYLIGLLTEFVPESVVTKNTKLVSFIAGSVAFVGGGIFECIENKVFMTLNCNLGWCSALANFVGGLWFLFGSLLGLYEGVNYTYWANFSFGIGAVVYALNSAVMLVMWKDEQFGLAFCAALNSLGGPTGRPLVLAPTPSAGGPREVEELATFSWRGASFIIIYILVAGESVYNFMCSIAAIKIGSNYLRAVFLLGRAFNALLPCIFAHALLALSSAVISAPKSKPFRQLFFFARFFAVLMIIFGTTQLVETLRGRGESGHLQDELPSSEMNLIY